MVLNKYFSTYKIIELLLIALPVALLFSNIIAEIIILIFIVFYFKEQNFESLKNTCKENIIFFLIIFWMYLILNSLVNHEDHPSFERSIFFFRFILLVMGIKFFVSNEKISIDKLFFYWRIIFLIICLDLFIQYVTHVNLIGFKAVQQGPIYRLGGFMDDELKISNLIYHFGVLTFSFFFNKNLIHNKSNFFNVIFLIILTVSIFLTAERSNFITTIFFIILFLIVFSLRDIKKFTLLLITFIIIFSVPFFLKNDLSNRMTSDLFNKIELFKIDNEKFYFEKDSHYFAHYSAAYQIFERNKFFGVGLKNFRKFCNDETFDEKIHPKWQTRKCATHPHNFYFEILSEIGIIGFMLIFSFFVFSFYIFLKMYKKTKNFFLLLSNIILIVYFVPFLPKGSFFTNWNAIIFWIIFAFIYSIYIRLKKQNV